MGQIYRKTATVGKSKEMKRIYGVIEKIAPMDVNVLISGEVGCGKDTLARVIHDISGRGGEFCILDPLSVSDDTCTEKYIEKVLRDTFTICNGGTVMIDDVANASKKLQKKLAFILSVRDDSQDTIYSKSRVIACTSRSIPELARQDRFRQDLCDILSVVSIDMPPLRHRKEDISELTNIFLLNCSKIGNIHKSVTKDTLSILMKYDWPGNIRELENVLTHASTMCDGLAIEPNHLPAKVKRKNAFAPKATVRDELYKLAKGLIESGAHLEKSDTYVEYMKIVETPLLKAAMDMSNGNKSLAAKKIKINRNTLNKKLQEYDIE